MSISLLKDTVLAKVFCYLQALCWIQKRAHTYSGSITTNSFGNNKSKFDHSYSSSDNAWIHSLYTAQCDIIGEKRSIHSYHVTPLLIYVCIC